MKKILSIVLLMFCYMSLSATKGCREDYILFEEQPTSTPTATATEEGYEEGDEEGDEEGGEEGDEEGGEDEGDTTRTPTRTPINTDEFTDDLYGADSFDEEDDDIVQGSSQNVKARLNMNNLLEDLEDLSQEGENYNWLGNAFNDNDSDNDFNTLYGNDDIDNDSDDEDMNDDSMFQDSDGDGYSDVLELELDTDVNSSTSFPYIQRTRLYNRVSPEEINNALNNAVAIDSNNDGLSDELERVLGTNPYTKDTDNDGISDYREFNNGTDPLISEF